MVFVDGKSAFILILVLSCVPSFYPVILSRNCMVKQNYKMIHFYCQIGANISNGKISNYLKSKRKILFQCLSLDSRKKKLTNHKVKISMHNAHFFWLCFSVFQLLVTAQREKKL